MDLKLGYIVARDMMKYAEDIIEIVDSANNEMRLETQLADLNKTWRDMNFQYKTMEEFPELKVLFMPEELVQTLEESRVAVQNYLSSENISCFTVTLTEWQNKLMNADRVTNVWLDLQYYGTHLRPILLGSGDIRRRLPKAATVV